jgi:hypothetical protein
VVKNPIPQLPKKKSLLGVCGKNNIYNKNNCMLMLKPLLHRFWPHYFWAVSGEKILSAAAKGNLLLDGCEKITFFKTFTTQIIACLC